MTRSLDLARSEASRVIVPSAATRADCLDHGIGLDRLRVVHWGVDPVEISDGDRVVVKERYELPSEFLLWVGTAEPRKNLPRLVQAHRLSGVDLPLILAGPKGWGPDLESIIGGYEGVRHIGPLAGADLAVLYDLASVFIYPSLLEGFGMPVLEAMGQGTPVITSRGTATEEVAGEGGVLVDPLDVGEMAAAIVSLSSDTERRGMLSSAAISRAAELDWQRTAELTTAVYEEAVG